MNQPTKQPYKCWRFVFSERTGISTKEHQDGIVPLDNITVCGQDYVKVPDAYRFNKRRDVIVSIYGITKTSETPVALGIQTGNYTLPVKPSKPNEMTTNPPVYEERCGAYCDGNYQGQAYAYQFKIYEKISGDGGSTHLAMETPAQSYVGEVPIPFYGYYSTSDANAWLAARNYPYGVDYYINDYHYDWMGISQKLETTALGSGVHVYTPSGIPISGDYYMIPKDFGAWRSFTAYLSIPNYQFEPNNCNQGNQSLGLYTNQMNSYINSIIPTTSQITGWTNLACYGDGGSFSEGEDGWVDNGDWGNDTEATFYDDIVGHANITSGTGTGTGSKPIYSYNGNSNVPREKIKLKAGLYKMELQYKNGS